MGKFLIPWCLLLLAAAEPPTLETVDAWIQESRYAEADSVINAELARLEAAGGGDTLAAAAWVDRLLDVAFSTGAGGEGAATAWGDRALAVREAEEGPSARSLAEPLRIQARILSRGGEIDRAEPAARRALEIATQYEGAESPALAPYEQAVGAVLKDAGRYRDALAHLERAVALAQQAFGPEDPRLRGYYNDLGTTYRRLGRNREAREQYDLALPLSDPEQDPAGTASLLINLGTVLKNERKLQRAIEVQSRAVELRETAMGPDHLLVGVALHQLAEPVRLAGNHARAEGMLQRSRRIFEKELPADHLYLAMSHMRMGNLLEDRGQLVAARDSMLESRRVYLAKLGEKHPSVAYNSHNLGNILKKMWQFDDADARYAEAVAAFREIYATVSVDEAMSLMGRGQVAIATGAYEAAAARYQEALGILDELGESDHPYVSNAYAYLGMIAWGQGDLLASRRWLDRADETTVALFGTSHPRRAWVYVLMARVDKEEGDLQAAFEHTRDAAEMLRRSYGEDSPNWASFLVLQAELELERGDLRAALDHALLAERVARDHVRSGSQTLPERVALRYAGIVRTARDVALRVADEHSLEAEELRRVWEMVVASRGIVQDEMAHRNRRAQRDASPEVAELLAEAERARREHAWMLYRAERDELEEADVLRAARRRKEDAEEELARASTPVRSGVSAVELDAIRAALPARSALVSVQKYRRENPFWRREPAAGEGYVAFLMDGREAVPTRISMGRAAPLEDAVIAWRGQIGDVGTTRGLRRVKKESHQSLERYQAAARALGEVWWEPLRPHLDQLDRVFVVPDGALHFVNPETLLDRDDAYLVESAPLFHFLSTERALLDPGASPSGGKVLAFGGIDYGPAPPDTSRGACPRPSDLAFGPLPETAPEVAEVAQLFTEAAYQVETLVGPEASEATFKALAPTADVLHLATHAFALGSGCEADDRVELGEVVATGDENPLMYAGLALAQANERAMGRSEDDGVLTAEEIARLDLSAVDWVVLSACETGLGQLHSGEGVLGLRRAFEVAGARSLVLSLWSVEDRAAREWMRHLYRERLHRGSGPAEAVRAASRAVLRERRESGRDTHPYYWGAFIGTGAWQ